MTKGLKRKYWEDDEEELRYLRGMRTWFMERKPLICVLYLVAGPLDGLRFALLYGHGRNASFYLYASYNEQMFHCRGIWKWLAAVPWPPVLALCLFIPGIILWAIFALKCKHHTIVFFNTVAPVSSTTINAVSGAVNTTLITLAVGGGFVFVLAFVLAIARCIQQRKSAPNCWCPCGKLRQCARPMPLCKHVNTRQVWARQQLGSNSSSSLEGRPC
jgi:hypothetical protein